MKNLDVSGVAVALDIQPGFSRRVGMERVQLHIAGRVVLTMEPLEAAELSDALATYAEMAANRNRNIERGPGEGS